MNTAGQVLQKLKQVGYAAVKGDVRPADEVSALYKMSNIPGLYRGGRADRDRRPVVTHLTVVLNRGHGGTAIKTQRIVDSGTPLPSSTPYRLLEQQ